MEVVIADEHKLAQLAADAIERLLRTETAPVLGLATGSSPLRIYDELAARHERQGLSFAHAQAFMLDEYVGIAADHPERYRNVIDTEIATRVDFARRPSTVPTVPPRTWRPPRRGTSRRSPRRAGSTCRSWASAPMGTSRSTNRGRPWPHAPG